MKAYLSQPTKRSVSILLRTLCKADAGLCRLQPHKPGRHASASARSKHQAAKAGGHRQSIKASSQPTHSKQQRHQVAAARRWADVHHAKAAAMLLGFLILTTSTCCGCASHSVHHSGAVSTTQQQSWHCLACHTCRGCSGSAASHSPCHLRHNMLCRPTITGSPLLPLLAQCNCRTSQPYYAAACGARQQGVHGLYRKRWLYLLAHKMLRDADRS